MGGVGIARSPGIMHPLSVSTFHRNGVLLSAGLGLLVTLAVLPPFVPVETAGWIMKAFAPVCHQLADRSFHIDGVQLAVCHRCLGAYIGLLTGVVTFLFMGRWSIPLRPLTLLVLGALPGVVDWSGDIVGVWVNSPTSRIATGAFFGVLAGLILGSAVMGERAKEKGAS